MPEKIQKEVTIFDYLPKVLPILDVVFIFWIAFTSPDPWTTTPIHLALPICAGTAIVLLRDKGQLGFYLMGVFSSVPMFFLNFWGSPDCPTWLNELTFIAGGMLLTKTWSDRFVVLGFACSASLIPLWLSGNSFNFIVTVALAEISIWFLMERSVAFMNLQRRQVENQKKIIEEKNKDITDSINYSKRIQQAKLPRAEEILASLPQSFVLFKPKDIVSGDFYYFHKKDQLVFIAAADCTGHGVPGALMSMVGSEKLNDAVMQSNIPGEILSYLNRGLRASLRQTNHDDSTRDGMDIALCVIDERAGTLSYSGANRPIWIVRNGQQELEEIKATKKAIGGLTDDEQFFEQHDIAFSKGDSFYISTDGYGDTFHGVSGKKLTTKKFKDLLISMKDLPLQEQKSRLDHFIEEWKQGSEQVDDILVIGVRL
jgi:serine phosphatase RsbU (regulator of sigma subunit)